ncbi:putative arylamine N-acetyltransferase [Streptomyces sp. NBRC 110611]|uniref:arylamine N-acetyltransferase family protein n=1 Tax=Streptomyces sp. NBRC 110611 TaxID=1621259 RepID=UPI00082CCD0B|nr:arylamine N-acetyltransferase [Streptomyces sp. NBRC 110611]GAU68802.1 putative arylamine N-acetyltransferase [Streptomyces sp. NBRC 110611]
MTNGSEWGGEQLDLDAYLARIGYDGDRRPTLETLRRLHAAHSAAFAFENLDVVLGRPILLDLESLQAKMVRQRRGGYCYEQNLLYAAALERLGFRVSGLCARTRMGDHRLRPATHALLRVDLDGEDWITDVGFGGEALLAPLPLRDGVEARQGAWTFGLVREEHQGFGEGDEPWVLRTRHEDGWFDLYAFGTERRFPADYAVFNHYISTHPRSPFTGRIVVQRPLPELRSTLVGREFTRTRPDWSREVREVTPEELPALLETEFGLTLPAADAEALAAYQEE